MKRAAAAIFAAAGLALVPTAQAQCGIGCLNGKVRALSNQLQRTQRALLALVHCFGEAPLTRYGGSGAGYVYDPGGGAQPFDTAALDITNSGDTIGAWMLFDRCNSTKTASVMHSVRRALIAGQAPIAPGFVLQPQRR